MGANSWIILLALCAALGVVASPAAADSLGPTPVPCSATVQVNCTFLSRCADLAFSPTVVHVGEDIVGDAGPATDKCGPSGAKAVSWTWGPYPGLTVVSGCHPKSGSCRLKAVSPTGTPGHRFVVACINGGSGFGPWLSCEYFAVTGPGKRGISGRVLTKSGKPVSGAEISIDGPTARTVRTDITGPSTRRSILANTG